MKFKLDKSALLAAGAMILGGIATLFKDYVDNKKMEELVETKVDERIKFIESADHEEES